MPNTSLPKPLYFAAGATDLAVEKLREIPAEYKRLQDQARQVDVATVRAAVEDYSMKTSGKAVEVYADLVSRGQRLLNSIRRQQATQLLTDQLASTRSQAKATATTARKSATQTRTRAKATTTSVRKSATAARRASKSAARKVG
ncbi:MAG: hypothetical protein M3042_10825 [Actinomycetota bacterium]|nr:hypothetical protein [Actinomycetota bacterium]